MDDQTADRTPDAGVWKNPPIVAVSGLRFLVADSPFDRQSW